MKITLHTNRKYGKNLLHGTKGSVLRGEIYRKIEIYIFKRIKKSEENEK